MDYKTCPVCKEKVIKDELNTHVEKVHGNLIPVGQAVGEFIYLQTHDSPRKCMICKNPTSWNNKTNRYNAFCSEKCKEEYVKIAKERMVKVYGKEYILNNPEVQKKMLANRSISGKYVCSDGGILTYTGSYERDFCEMMDLFLQYPSNDILMPSPNNYEYIYNEKKHFYIPDVFIPSLGIEIEIKDGGDNPNMHHKIQNVDKVKEKLKDDVMIKQQDYHYIKIKNKNYNDFFDLLEGIVNKTIKHTVKIL